MPDWLIERGIGETRAVRIEAGEIVEARILLDGIARAGTVLQASLKQVGKPAVARAGGTEFLLPAGAPGIAEGARLAIEITREAIPGKEPWKRPLARVVDAGQEVAPAFEAKEIAFPAPSDVLEDAGWSDLLEEARSGVVRFAGGELLVSSTPAMCLIDVDGRLPAAELARAAAAAAVRTILRHGIGGSIGVDFPTIAGRAERQAIGAAVDQLLPKPFERTAVNGFGFLQIVRPRRHASLFELAADRPAFELRALLRRAARSTGAVRLVAHPAVAALIQEKAAWTDELARQVGGHVTLRPDPALPISAGYAEPA